jgi:predicted RNase H-like nuclease (RuvC/YqgF family)
MSKTHGTNVHTIDGKTYVEVERKAVVGEKVIVVNAEHTCGKYKNGDVFEVQRLEDIGIENDAVIAADNSDGIIYHEEYCVLEPVADADEQPVEATANDPRSMFDLLANLARRVNSLERQVESLSTQLKDTQGNVERQGVEIAELEKLTDSNEEDIRELDDRTQVINAIQKHYDGGAR